MTELVVRRLLVDMQAPLDRHWCGGDAFKTAFFNALSMSFPVGEQFFMDSVRRGFKALPAEKQGPLAAEIQGFVGQEATHRRLHSLFNAHLSRHGLVNAWEPKALKRLAPLAEADPRHGVAITAANEHFTAIFADWLLAHPEVLADSEERLKSLWLWHCAEEAEHKSTAFDVYRALDGSEAWRKTWFRRVTLIFLADTLSQTVDNLRRDGSLWRWRTWVSGARFLLGRHGLITETFSAWRQYLRTGFHPNDLPSPLSQAWLTHNRDRYTPVGAPRHDPTTS